MNITKLKKILEEHHLAPNKRLGQSFLIDNNIVEKMIKTADISKEDTILEIGTGLGTLTKELAKHAKQVISFEKDKGIFKISKEILKDYKNVEIIHGDILRFGSLASKYKIVSNLPYYITSPVIRKFLETDNLPQEMTFIIQKEVAQRICAQTPRMNLLAISVQVYTQPKIIHYISQNCFWPRPKVDSAIIKISNIKKPEGVNMKKFFKLVKAGFSSPRKQLANNLEKILGIPREQIKRALAVNCSLSPQARAQELSVADWKIIAGNLNPRM